MKIRVDIDCTPEEARAFLGLPDVKPLQEAMMKDAQARMATTLEAMDPETFMRMWMPWAATRWKRCSACSGLA